MSDKLEALSQPIGLVTNQLDGAVIVESDQLLPGDNVYSQGYVTALLAALEEKDRRVVELEEIATGYAANFQKAQDSVKYAHIINRDNEKRIAELEQRLQQPIKLTQRYETAGYCIAEHYCQEADDGDYLDRDELIASLREQGYQVEGE